MSTHAKYPLQTLKTAAVSKLLLEIPDPPSTLYIRGNIPSQDTAYLAVVGSRHYTNYAPQVINYLIGGLEGYSVAIVSGLAIGVDTLAHETALRAGLTTVSVPGSGIDESVIYPARNKPLAMKILESGGTLLSEFEPTFRATKWSFPKRNRIMAGLSHATLLIEASEKSGTLITARLATDYNRELLVVPGNILRDNSKGVHQFLKLGATPITTPEDIVEVLGLSQTNDTKERAGSSSEEEAAILALLTEPKGQDEIIRLLPYPPAKTLTLLMKMELRGTVINNNGSFVKNR